MPPLYEIRPVNARAVLILLECILVLFNKRYVFANCNKISSRQESSTAKLYAIWNKNCKQFFKTNKKAIYLFVTEVS